MSTLPIKVNGVTVLTFDITNQDIILNTLNKNVSQLNVINTAALCSTSNCYNCSEKQCHNVNCYQVQCTQIHCHQVKCTGYDIHETHCQCECSGDS